MDREVPSHPSAQELSWIGTLITTTVLAFVGSAHAEDASELDGPDEIDVSQDALPTADGHEIDSAVDREKALGLETPRPSKWGPTYGRQCHRWKGRRVCEGPRRVALPHGAAEERAKRLGLGLRRTATVLQRQAPLPEWLEVLADGASTDEESLHWPVDGGQLWRGFGYVRRRGRKRLHRGIDVGAPAGTSIRAVQRGLVAFSDNTIQGYGNMMLIIHADETVGWYAHCQANYVFAGQMVERGQIIGEVGSTGLAQGAHLHFELRREGRPFNPLPLFENPPVRRNRHR